jgi:hypothetical protein
LVPDFLAAPFALWLNFDEVAAPGGVGLAKKSMPCNLSEAQR